MTGSIWPARELADLWIRAHLSFPPAGFLVGDLQGMLGHHPVFRPLPLYVSSGPRAQGGWGATVHVHCIAAALMFPVLSNAGASHPFVFLGHSNHHHAPIYHWHSECIHDIGVISADDE